MHYSYYSVYNKDGPSWTATTEEEHGVVIVHGDNAALIQAQRIFRTRKYRGEKQAPWAKVVLSEKGDNNERGD